MIRVLIFLFLFIFSFKLKAEEKIKIISYDLKAISGFNKAKAKVLENIILGELFNYERLGILDREDWQNLMGEEQDLSKLESCDFKKCLIEISGALGVDYILSREIRMLGDKTVILNLIILDAQENINLLRVYSRVNNQTEDKTLPLRKGQPFYAG